MTTVPDAGAMPVWRRWCRDVPLRRTVSLSVVLAVVSSWSLFELVGLQGGPVDGLRMSWWQLAIAFALAELCVFHIELRREAHTFSLSEVPLVLGLLFASPLSLVVGRLVGEALVLGVHERQSPRKLVLNLSSFLTECVAGLAVVRLAGGVDAIERPSTWLVALVAVGVADLLSVAAVGLAIRWHGGPVPVVQLIVTSVMTAVTNTSLALVASLLLLTSPWSAVLMATVVLAVVAAYRGYSSLSHRFAGLQLLYDFTSMVSGAHPPDEVLQGVLSKARELLRGERAGIYVAGDEAEPESQLWVGADDAGSAGVGPAAVHPLPAGLAAELLALATTVVAPRDSRDPLHIRLVEALGVGDCVVSPLAVDGSMGLLIVADRQGSVSTFDAEDGRLFATLANHASVALENGRLIERLRDEARRREHDALHDTLTGLPNRSLLHRRLEQAIREREGTGAGLSVALIDLDHFKEVNDTLGHPVGDQLLRHVAASMRAHLDGDVTIARLGGDEFAVLIPDVVRPEDLLAVGHRMQQAITVPHTVEGLSLEVGASIGFAVFPADGADAATLIQRADIAMYIAKGSSTDNLELYRPDLDSYSPRRLTLASDLRRAVEDGQLTLYYQPKARLGDGAIIGAEALVRWQHPQLGFVPPDEFVPLVERTGLIQPFTDVVLGLALSQADAWAVQGLDLEVAVNLSTRNLMDRGLPARIDDLLRRMTSGDVRLTFEITESTIMAEPTVIIRVLEELSSLGARLSVDDFGTGHSSLAYLQRLPVNELKIDKSFIIPLTTDPGADAIVRSVLDLARNLGLKVVAEGVEDQIAWDRLRHLSCDVAQGYFLSRPLPAADFGTWLRARRATAGLVDAVR